MPQTHAGFVDIGYLHAEGAKAVGNNRSNLRPIATDIVAWFRDFGSSRRPERNLDRVYRYDSAFGASDRRYSGQQRAFNAIA